MKLKALLIALLFLVTPLMAQETNTPPVNVVVIVLTDTNMIPLVTQAITNKFPSALFYKVNPKILQFETQIKLMQKRIKEQYEGYPDTYVGDGTPESQRMLDTLIEIWKKKKADEDAVEAKKLELRKLLVE